MKKIELVIGGKSKQELLYLLAQNQILLNSLGEQLLHSQYFTTTSEVRKICLTELSVAELGLSKGGTLLEIFRCAYDAGFDLCPIEVGVFLRLSYFSQTDNQGLNKTYKAPEGAMTVASKIFTEDIEFPKGFYLRKIDGSYWLRGYICDYEHLFDPKDKFVFLDRD